MPIRKPRDQWVEAGLKALADGGPDAVRVEVLAKALGVTKGGFYGSFDDRAALLDALLDEWERRSTMSVLEEVEQEGGDAVAKIRRVGQLTMNAELNRIDFAVRDWARRDKAVARRLRRIDNVRMGFLREMFGRFIKNADEVEARSTLAFSLAIGRHFIAADSPGRTKRESLQLAIGHLLKP